MGRGPELKTRVFVSIHGAPEVPWESLTTEQQEYAGQQIAKNFMKGLSDYYSAHPDEYKAFCEANPEGCC